MIRSSATINPGTYVISSLILTIALGTAALCLPCCQTTYVSLTDAMLTAISAATVTGLMTIPITAFSTLGKIVIMLLMQLGGLGLMTMSLFAISLIMDLGISTQFIASELLELEAIKNVKRTLLFIITITVAAELLGILALLPFFMREYSLGAALLYSSFHTISSFCNAGMVLPETAAPMLTHHMYLLSVTACLMFAGGLGFITWYELYHKIRLFLQQKAPLKFSLHSKIVLFMAMILLIIGSCVLLALEWSHAFAHMPWQQKIIAAVFNAVSMKSTGFLTAPLYQFQLATIFAMLLLAFIGSSPGSTGSGLKTTTVAILAATVRSMLRGLHEVQLAKRRISMQQVLKSATVLILSLTTLALLLFALLITEQSTLLSIIVEAVSAVTNLGISIGLTMTLTDLGKFLIGCGMIIGRIGTYTLVLSLITMHKVEVSYPEERIMLT